MYWIQNLYRDLSVCVTAATILGGGTALGYMVIGLLAFILGVCVTILCFRIRQLDKEEQTEEQKGDNGDGADQ